MKNVLVTGGAGFIGSNFVKYLLKNRPELNIVNLDALTYAGNLNNLTDIEDSQNYTFIKGDIADEALIEQILNDYDIDTIVNFAAESHVDRSLEDAETFGRTNILGTLLLMNAAMKYWQNGRDEQGYPTYRDGVRFHQVSTDEVYGALGKEGFFTETTPLAPNSPYSASKASADLLVRSFVNSQKFPASITRCSNNYGRYQFPEKLIPLMIGNILELKDLPIYGDGRQIRDWLHVDDHCSAILTVIEDGLPGEIYNVGGNNEKANIEIVDLLIEKVRDKLGKDNALGVDVEKINGDLKKHVRDRLGHDARYAIDNTKITSELGWEPAYTFEDGIDETVDWYLNNQDWLEQVRDQSYQDYYDKMYDKR